MALVLRHNRPVALREYAMEQTKDSIAWLRDYITAIKNGRFHPFTPLERKAREATRNEAWGPTGTLLNELAEATFDHADCQIVYAVIEFRLGYPNLKWRNVYKALTVLEFLIKRGSDQAVENAQTLLPKLSDLQVFEYTSPDGRDHGINVRHRAQAISVLLKDTERLQQERTAFASKRKVYKGFSNEQMSKESLQRTHSADSMDRQFSFRHPANHGSSSRYSDQSPNIIMPSTRNAGEMKGITMEDNKVQLAALKKLLDLPHNKQCADCVGGGGAARASWASINTGVFICMRCAGIHRGLGVHVSKVRSCTLDTWLPEQVSFMAATGNAAANAFWEAKLASNQKPHYESADLQPFIRRKYCNKEFAEGSWPPATALDAASQATSSDKQAQRGPGSSASVSAGPAPAQQQPAAGRSEAGGYWGSLTPQESVPNHILSREASVGLGTSPPLLIDLMDFGAESTFQLPTTPRRRTSGTAPLMFDSPADIHAASAQSSSLPSQGNAASAGSSNQAGISSSSARQASASGAAEPAVVRQPSNFPYLPPPPQVTRQLGPPQTANPPAPPQPIAPAPPVHSDMAVNTDADLGGLEGLILQADSGPLDPFSQSLHSSLDLSSVPQMAIDLPSQQSSQQAQGQFQGSAQNQLHVIGSHGVSNNSIQGHQQHQQGQGQIGLSNQLPVVSGLPVQQSAPSQPQPIFFQGQWFTPAPANFVPPPHLNSLTQQQFQQQLPPQVKVVQQLPMWQQRQQQAHSVPSQQAQPQQQQQQAHSEPSQQAQQPQQSYPQAQGSSAGGSGRDTGTGEWSPTQQGQFESPTFRDGAAKQLAPGPSGRTWGAPASDVTRLSLAGSQAASTQPKDGIAVLDDLLLDALEGLQVKAQLDSGIKNKAAKPAAMKERPSSGDKLLGSTTKQVQVHSDARSGFGS